MKVKFYRIPLNFKIKFNTKLQQHISLLLHTARCNCGGLANYRNSTEEAIVGQRYSTLRYIVTHITMFLHGTGIYATYLRKENIPDQNSNQEEPLSDSDFTADTQTESEDTPETVVPMEVPAETENATEIAMAILNAVVESVHIISGGIPLLSDHNPAEQLEVSAEVAEIIQSVFRGKADLVTTDRRLSSRVKHSPKPRANYASEDDINSAIGPLSSSDRGSWRKPKKPKVTFGPNS